MKWLHLGSWKWKLVCLYICMGIQILGRGLKRQAMRLLQFSSVANKDCVHQLFNYERTSSVTVRCLSVSNRLDGQTYVLHVVQIWSGHAHICSMFWPSSCLPQGSCVLRVHVCTLQAAMTQHLHASMHVLRISLFTGWCCFSLNDVNGAVQIEQASQRYDPDVLS